MAALYLHNSLWVPDPEPNERALHMRTTSATTIQTLQFSDQSHPTQPLLHSATSESVAYLDLLSRQPSHPNAPRAHTPAALSFDGDPTTLRERKDQFEQAVRRRLRRLKVMMGILELVMGCWALYTTIRYFIAFAAIQGGIGQTFALILGTISIISFSFLIAGVAVPFLQLYILSRKNLSIAALLTVRLILRYTCSLLILFPAVINFILTFVWRSSSSSVALKTAPRCDADVDVVWTIRAHADCSGQPAWGPWLILAIMRLLITLLVLIIYHLSLASYAHTRRPSRHGRGSSASDTSTYIGSPPMSGRALLPTHGSSGHHSHPSSSSSLNSNSRLTPAPERRPLRSTRPASSVRPHSFSGSISRGTDAENEDEFDPYRDLNGTPLPSAGVVPVQSEADRELYSFVNRFRSLVAQVTQDGSVYPSPNAYPSPSPDAPSSSGEGGYLDEFGRPLSMSMAGYAHAPTSRALEDRVLILNSYIRRMPTIESLGSREVGSVTGTAPSVAGSSVVGEHRGSLASGHTLSRAPTLSTVNGIAAAGAGAGTGETSIPTPSLSRTGSFRGSGEGVPSDLTAAALAAGERERVVRRMNSVASSAASSSYLSASPMHTPIAEEPSEDIAFPLPLPTTGTEISSCSAPSSPLATYPLSTPTASRTLPTRPLPRPPSVRRADSA